MLGVWYTSVNFGVDKSVVSPIVEVSPNWREEIDYDFHASPALAD
jgi:hypothetical protein